MQHKGIIVVAILVILLIAFIAFNIAVLSWEKDMKENDLDVVDFESDDLDKSTVVSDPKTFLITKRKNCFKDNRTCRALNGAD